jgi:hypothetical protein
VVLATLSQSDWIALGAVLIAGGALILALFALVVALRGETQPRPVQKPDEAPSERPTEVHDTLVAPAVASRGADLKVTPGLAVPDGRDRRRYGVVVRNAGNGRADDVRLSVEDERGETVSLPSSSEPLSLAGGEEGQAAVWMAKDAARPGLWFAVGWRDDDGEHQLRTDAGLPW